MTIHEEITAKIRQLPEALAQEVNDHIDFLLMKQSDTRWQLWRQFAEGLELAESDFSDYLPNLEDYENKLARAECATMRKIAVGSQNPVKLEAVRRVLARVCAQPMSAEEAILGARVRAQAALELSAADLGFGLEGAVEETPWGLFLVNWVVIVDAQGREGLGSGGRLLLPQQVAQALRDGGELGPVMDALTSITDSKKGLGANGILTAGLLTRAQAFEVGVINALAPLVSPQFYRK